MKDDERDLRNDEIRMSRLTKEMDRREVRNGTDDESQGISIVNKMGDSWKGNNKENENDDIVGNFESLPKSNSSRNVAESYNRTFSDKKSIRTDVEQESMSSA